jgi:hypothetical protein
VIHVGILQRSFIQWLLNAINFQWKKRLKIYNYDIPMHRLTWWCSVKYIMKWTFVDDFFIPNFGTPNHALAKANIFGLVLIFNCFTYPNWPWIVTINTLPQKSLRSLWQSASNTQWQWFWPHDDIHLWQLLWCCALAFSRPYYIFRWDKGPSHHTCQKQKSWR